MFYFYCYRSNAADFTAGRESVGQFQFLPAEKKRDTRIIKSAGSGTNAGKHSGKIAGLRFTSRKLPLSSS